MKGLDLKPPFPAEDLYKNLNESQRKAVQAFEGPVLVLAGAGSGKTRVLVYRVSALLLERKCALDSILAVTFTNKSAKEMKERVFSLLSSYGQGPVWTPWIGTFHSVCAQILRQNIHLLPGRKNVVIYDQGEQLSLVKKVLWDLNIDPKIKDPKSVRAQINLCKRMGLGPHELFRQPSLVYDKPFEKIYEEYEKALRQNSAFDFESLLLETYRLLRKEPDFLKSLQNKFQYICVDEYQDTNHIQYLLIKELAGEKGNVCVVGDEDQSIYSWRGADMNNIMDFERDFSPCRVFFLEENYRSTKNIVQGANGLIARNKARKGKTLVSQKGLGRKIHIRENFDEREEGKFIAESVRAACAGEGKSFGDFAALYRANAQSRVLEDHLRALRIPYKIVGGVRFYERKEIKEILSYLKLILNSDDDVSFLAVINSPRRGFGKNSIARLQREALRARKSLYESLRDQLRQKLIKGKALKEARGFIACIEDLKSKKGKAPLFEIYSSLLEQSGYVEDLERQKSLEAESRIENLQELGGLIGQKESQLKDSFLALDSFLEEMSLLTEADKTLDGKNCVTLMTLHNSKGLEFDSVFIAGMEEGLFPSFQSLEDGNVEEERRLAYVGMTRAKERLTLSFARKRRFWGRDQYNPPSRFLSEIPKEFVRCESLSLFGLPGEKFEPNF